MVNYEIVGGDVQYLKSILNEGESMYVEPGHLIYKSPSARLDVRAGGLRGAFSHMLAGSDVFLLKVDGPGEVASAGFLPGKVFKIELNNNSIIAEFNAFLCMDSTVNYSTKFAGLWQGVFGGEGLFLEKFSGTGSVMMHGHGQVIERELKPGEEIQVELSHVLAFEETVGYNVVRIGGLKTMVLGGLEGEGLFFANMTGPGKVWLHSISLFELSAKLARR
ncbi:TIGR00266 family protein [Picrophilus oshimae]|uniref:HTH DNA-binding protein n=1 Tax=Picrophilus torridus (strain ATCC 700027 / DSM 9790 / JCM 10055 / NBRC 100828 / KAW 2/3) TaxID=1122961 RepID=Q6L115_PICTO|nr:TIGR00266 family protein [Picrophilus oshimae]AAT43337.1 HTH DNA-binding protein [Picrophilus oshimae DSM 9789]